MQGINAWVTCVGYPSSNSSVFFTSVVRQRSRLGPRWSDWNATRDGELTPYDHPERPSGRFGREPPIQPFSKSMTRLAASISCTVTSRDLSGDTSSKGVWFGKVRASAPRPDGD